MARIEGVYGLFAHPHDLLHAAEKTRERDYKDWDCMTPFPLHGLDDAMGLGRSWLPWVTFAFGLTGFSIAVLLQVGIMVFNWPMNFGGRPFLSFPDFVPIMFELTVLLGGLATFFTVFISGRMPNFKPRILDQRITDDQFALWISADNDGFNADEVRQFIQGLGADEVHLFHAEDEA